MKMMKRQGIIGILLVPVAACIIVDVFSDQHGRGWHALPWNAAREILHIATSSGWSRNDQVAALALSVIGVLLLLAYIAAGLVSYRKRSLPGSIATMIIGVLFFWGWALFVLIPLCVIPQT